MAVAGWGHGEQDRHGARRTRPAPARPSQPARWGALVCIQLGAVAVVLASTPYKRFELDRFFVPKELALHVTALVVALLALWRVRTFALDRTDTLLLGYVALGALSTLLATDWSLATRALALTLSGVALFWGSRAIAEAGLRRPLLIALLVAVTLGALTGLAQAYGMDTEYASLSRAPGGTLGNRNFLAHLCAIVVPALLWCTVTARRRVGAWLGALTAAILSAALVLSRSRAAWLALAAWGVALALPTWLAVRRSEDPRVRGRVSLLALFAALGVLLALALPNRLNWKSDSPYLDSVRGVVDYSSGSGRGRLIQYKNTLRMAEAHPVLGVGPGNWPLYYPHYATRHDPSLSHATGAPANPWPSSDWVALVAERGWAATLLLLLALVGVFVSAWRTRAEDAAPSVASELLPFTLAGTLLITVVVGAFDAVLLIAAPTLIAWTAFGALSHSGRPRVTLAPSPRVRRWWITLGATIGVLIVVRSALQVVAMATTCSWPSAVTLDRCRTDVRHDTSWLWPWHHARR